MSAALAFCVSDSEGEAVLPLHQVAQEQHRLVVRVVQYVLEPKNKKGKRTNEFRRSAFQVT